MSGKKKSAGGRPRKDQENLTLTPDRNDVASTSGARNQCDVVEENRILRKKLAEIQGKCLCTDISQTSAEG